MSNLRQGILRAVRLLPDVVKIGIDTGSALPSVQEEEQLLNERPSVENQEEDPVAAADPLKELADQLTMVQVKIAAAEKEKSRLAEKIAALETENTRMKETFDRKERELTAGAAAAGEQARTEGRAQGHAEGLESGYSAGLEKARVETEEQYKEKFSNLVTLLEGISTKLEENFLELTALNQPRMLRLWQEMLKKMLQREMTLAPEAVLNVLSDVLNRLSDKNHVLIYVAPADLQLLEERMQEEFEDVLRGVRHLELKADTNVDRGSCLVETNLGVYDARWRTQLGQIDSVLEKLFGKLGKVSRGSTSRSRKKTAESAEEAAEPVVKTPTRKTAAKKTTKKALGPNATFVPSKPETADASD